MNKLGMSMKKSHFSQKKNHLKSDKHEKFNYNDFFREKSIYRLQIHSSYDKKKNKIGFRKVS